MHVLVVNNIYPADHGGRRRTDRCLAERRSGGAWPPRHGGLDLRARDREPHPVETRNGVTVIRFFPRNVYWNFARQGQTAVSPAALASARRMERDAGRRFRAVLAEAPPDIVHTHLIDGFSAAIWRRARRAGVPIVHTAHDYHLLCPRAFMLTHDWQICRQPRRALPALSRWHLPPRAMSICSSARRASCSSSTVPPACRRRRRAVVRNGIPLPRTPRRRVDQIRRSCC